MSDFSPISRLLSIIELAGSKNRNLSVRELWSDVLGFDKNDAFQAFEYSLSLYKLIENVEYTLSIVSHDNESILGLYSQAFEKLKKIPPLIPYGSEWRNYESLVSKDVVTSLEFGKAYYEASSSNIESKIGDQYLDDLIEKVEILWGEVFNGDLPAGLRFKLLDDIVALKKSISKYELFGIDEVESAVSSLGGRVGLHAFELDKLQNAAFFNSLNDVFDSFVSAAKAANESFAMIENGKRFISIITGGSDS
ncbi:hypothetical protein BIS09_10815 [Halomonas sp. R1t8]|uniref:hypothetical protein n=1 Tax=unclassified Halomonas TaxID=2609666 RepID=UPI00209F9CEF|nr:MULTISPECIES: hypothetical protein [unclassified Halomonas]MCP1304328.1 hypothetical protein [Halomonas sp. R1t8]MCP1329721.1 hypothetical protein [Halomonas sp. R1t4]